MSTATLRDFVRSYVITMRPYLLFVSGITGIAGMALGQPLALGAALAAGLAFFLSYGFGQAVTDCFQLDTDSISAPYRPLVQGRVKRRDVLAVSLVGLLACSTVLVWLRPLNALFAALTVLGLATYTYFKRRWWAGPFYNSWIVALLVVMGYLAAAGDRQELYRWSPVLAGTLILAFFGYANFVLTGYYKDISADRATGYRTLPVVFGLAASSVVSDGFAMLAAAGAALAVLAGGWAGSTPLELLPAGAFLAAGSAATLVAQVRLHAVRDQAAAYRAIVPVVHAYVLLLAAVAARHRPWWTLALVVFYAGFGLTMARRPEKEQI